ncbi:MAG: CAP domain-containing protein [Hyphomicrobium sp.]|nr:CAP domain-containing protein [Hyphomicrobium sp.]
MPVPLPEPPAVEMAVVEMTNAFRRENKLADVQPNADLSEVARSYAAYIAKSGTFSHTADGREIGDRVTSGGYAWCSVAENLAMHLDSRGFESRALAKKSVEGWINSPSHREAMLAPFATETGVGVARMPDNNPKYVTVQIFARPQSLAYEFQISNATPRTVSYVFASERHTIEPKTGVTHNACAPGSLEFETPGDIASARYEASDGMVYELAIDGKSAMTVTARPKVRID